VFVPAQIDGLTACPETVTW